MKTEEIKKVSYEEPEMEVVNINLESSVLQGSTEGGQGCTDDCSKDY